MGHQTDLYPFTVRGDSYKCHRWIKMLTKNHKMTPYDMTCIHHAVKEVNKCLRWLDRSRSRRPNSPQLAVGPFHSCNPCSIMSTLSRKRLLIISSRLLLVKKNIWDAKRRDCEDCNRRYRFDPAEIQQPTPIGLQPKVIIVEIVLFVVDRHGNGSWWLERWDRSALWCTSRWDMGSVWVSAYLSS